MPVPRVIDTPRLAAISNQVSFPVTPNYGILLMCAFNIPRAEERPKVGRMEKIHQQQYDRSQYQLQNLEFDLIVYRWVWMKYNFDSGDKRPERENARDCQCNQQEGENNCHIRLRNFSRYKRIAPGQHFLSFEFLVDHRKPSIFGQSGGA